MIRPATPADAAAIATIYNHYVRETVVTFEEEPVTDGEMARRIGEVLGASFPWLVAEENGTVLGYAYGAPWASRSGYQFSAEITVYLRAGQTGKGIGTELYDLLFPRLAARGVHAVIGGIALPNPASVALHERFGLRKVAHFGQVGYKFGQWIDVGYWHRILPPADEGGTHE